MRVARLRLHVHRLEAIERVHDGRQHQAGRIGARKAAVAVLGPLHRGADAVAVAEVDVVAHADLVAVIDHGRSGHGQQQAVHQLDAAAVALEQRGEPAADAEVDARPAIGRIGVPKVVAFLVGHHFERQFVMVAQKDRPLIIGRDLGRLTHDVGDREAILLGDRHVHARHERKVERHVAFVAVAEILLRVLGPLIGFGQQEPVLVGRVERSPDLLQDVVRLGKVLVVGALALDQVGDRVEPQPVDAHVEPEAHDAEHFLQHARVVEVEVGLVRIEAVPEILPGDRVPGPVRLLGVEEDDAGFGEFLIGVGPDVEVAGGRARLGGPGLLEQGVLIRRMVDHQFGDHPYAPVMGGADEFLELGHRPVVGTDVAIFGDVVAVVLAGRGIERQQPDGVDAEARHVIELGVKARQVADAVVVGVEERLDVQLVDDGVFVPERIVGKLCLGLARHY